MTSNKNPSRGFTLVELMAVIVIIGVLAAFAVPQYLKSVEMSKADDAVAVLKMVGSANRMYQMDNGNYTAGTLGTACNSYATCAASTDKCYLIGCKYIVPLDWASKGYTVVACNGAVSAACGGIGTGNLVAAATRKTSGNSSTTITPYSTWGYTLDVNGTIATYGTGTPNPTGL